MRMAELKAEGGDRENPRRSVRAKADAAQASPRDRPDPARGEALMPAFKDTIRIRDRPHSARVAACAKLGHFRHSSAYWRSATWAPLFTSQLTSTSHSR